MQIFFFFVPPNILPNLNTQTETMVLQWTRRRLLQVPFVKDMHKSSLIMMNISTIYRWRGSGNKAHFFSVMRYVVKSSLKPAMFSTAILLKKPTNPVTSPMTSANAHLRTRYWNIWTFFLDLQSCLNSSFSIILKIQMNEQMSRNLLLSRYMSPW